MKVLTDFPSVVSICTLKIGVCPKDFQPKVIPEDWLNKLILVFFNFEVQPVQQSDVPRRGALVERDRFSSMHGMGKERQSCKSLSSQCCCGRVRI